MDSMGTSGLKRSPADISAYPKGGVSWFEDSFAIAKSSVHRMKFSGKNLALWVTAKRYFLLYLVSSFLHLK